MDRVVIPSKFEKLLEGIIDWHLEKYGDSTVDDIRIKRIYEQFFERNKSNNHVVVSLGDLYYINDCVSNAIANMQVNKNKKDSMWDICAWIAEKRNKY